jgi:microcystin-dependent protein
MGWTKLGKAGKPTGLGPVGRVSKLVDVEVTGIIDLLGQGMIRTARDGMRVEIVSEDYDRITWYSGGEDETTPGRIGIYYNANYYGAGQGAAYLALVAPDVTDNPLGAAANTVIWLYPERSVTNNPIHITNGSASLPSLAASGDVDTGIYWASVRTYFTCAGTAQVYIGDGIIAPVTNNDVDLGSTSLMFKDGFLAGTLRADTAVQAGSATGYGIVRPTSNDTASCTLGFQGDPDTGIIRPGADRMRLVAGGTAIVELEPSGGSQPGLDLLAGDPWIAGVKHGWCPVGTIVMYGGSSAPTGWVLCDGTAYSRTVTYNTLYGVIGTTFGAGDGVNTFNVPDLRQRFPLGKAAAGTGSTLGGTGGLIDHTHTGPSHRHSWGPTGNPSATQTVQSGTGTAPASSSHTHTGGNTGYAGTGATGTENPPFQAVNFIIKY